MANDLATWDPNSNLPAAAPEPRNAAFEHDQQEAKALEDRQREAAAAQAEARRRQAEVDEAYWESQRYVDEHPGGMSDPTSPTEIALHDAQEHLAEAKKKVKETNEAVAESQEAKKRTEYREATKADKEAAAEDAKKGAEEFKKSVGASPKQRYQIAVPHSGTTLSFGASSSRGGAGASLVTHGSTLLDSCGPTDVQSAGAMSLQTSATFSAICNANGLFGSAASIIVSAGSQVKVYAGSAVAPGACGTGSPGKVASADMPPPAAGADAAVAKRTALTSIVKAGVSIAGLIGGGVPNPKNAGEMLGAADSVGGALGDTATVVQDVNTGFGGKNATVDSVAGGAATAGDILASIGAKNPMGVLGAGTEAYEKIHGEGGEEGEAAKGKEGGKGGEGGGAGGAEKGAGGGTTIDMQAPANIDMKTMATITGTAVANIEFKAGNKVSIKAGALIEAISMQVAIFGTVKVEVKTAVLLEMFAGVKIDMKTPIWEAKAGILEFHVLGKAEMKVGGLLEMKVGALYDVHAVGGLKMHTDGRALYKSGASTGIKATAVCIDSPKIVIKGETVIDKKLNVKDEVKVDKDITTKTEVQAKTGKIKSALQVLGAMKAG